MVLLGQASNAISYSRRLNVLKVVVEDPRKVKSILKEKASPLQQEDECLLGKKFRSFITETERSKKQTLEAFKSSTSDKKKPFRKGPSPYRNRQHSEGRFFYSPKLAGICTPNFYEAVEYSNSYFKTDKHSSDNLPGRYVGNWENNERNSDSKRYADFSSPEFGLHYQSKKVGFESKPSDRISRSGYRFSEVDIIGNTEEIRKNNETLQGSLFPIKHNNIDFNKVDRKPFVNCSSSFTCQDTISLPPTRTNLGIEKSGYIQRSDKVRLVDHGGTTMVVLATDIS